MAKAKKLLENEELAQALAEALDEVTVVETEAYDGPPQTGLVDQRRWRIAAMRDTTPKTDPWIKTTCHECRLPMWTRDPLSTWERGGVCDECHFLLLSRVYEEGRRQWGNQQRAIHDPFRPK